MFLSHDVVKTILMPLLFLLSVTLLSAEVQCKTVYEDHEYLTKGRLILETRQKKLYEVLTDSSSYSDWALQGMGPGDPNTEDVPALLTGIRPMPGTEGKLVEISFNLNTVIPRKNLTVQFAVDWNLNDDGTLESLSFDYRGRKQLLKEAEYTFLFTPLGKGIQVDFNCRARLAGLLELFFNEERYHRNISFYVIGLADNIKSVLEE